VCDQDGGVGGPIEEGGVCSPAGSVAGGTDCASGGDDDEGVVGAVRDVGVASTASGGRVGKVGAVDRGKLGSATESRLGIDDDNGVGEPLDRGEC
jgi:hypothetical protein